MDAALEQLILELETRAPALLTQRYLTAAALAILMYDQVLTTDDEMRLIWGQKLNVVRGMFIVIRYGTLGAMLFGAYVTSGESPFSHDTEFCQAWIVILSGICLISTGLSNFILVNRIYALYDQRRNVLRLLLWALVLTYLTAFAFGIVTIKQFMSSIRWDPYVYQSCVFTSSSRYLVGFWAPQTVFELFTFLLTIANAAERPRRAQCPLLTELHRDGFTYFVILFWLRVTNMILSALSNADFNLMVVFFSWSLTILTLLRLVLRAEDMSIHAREYDEALETTGRKPSDAEEPRVRIWSIDATQM